MKTIQINTNIPLSGSNTRKWRGAIIQQVLKHQHVFQSANVATHLFHNHDEKKWNDPLQKGRFDKRSQYPLVQYIEQDGKAGLIGIAAGAKALQLWAVMAGDSISLNGRKEKLNVNKTQLETYEFQYLTHLKTYRLNNWIPFNPIKVKAWKAAKTLVEKAQLLDKALFGHFMHAAEEWGLKIDKSQLKIHVKNCLSQNSVNCFGRKKQAFDVEISINGNLPLGLGLGQGASIGFGRIQEIN